MEFARRLLSAFLVCTYLSVFVYTPVTLAADQDAPNLVCGQDLNNNGYLGDEGEYVQCKISNYNKTTAATASCPSGYVKDSSGGCVRYTYTAASPACPAGSFIQNGRCISQSQIQPTQACETGSVNSTTRPGLCEAGPIIGECPETFFTRWSSYPQFSVQITNRSGARFCTAFYEPPYICPTGSVSSGSTCLVNTDNGPVQSTCPAGTTPENGQCKQTSTTQLTYSCSEGTLTGTNCVVAQSSSYCPIGVSSSCLAGGGGASCSPNQCIDITKNTPVDEGNIDGTTLVDDGEKSEDGVCLDQIYIFNGRASDCKLAGVSTAFKNCCKSEGKVYSDDVGPYSTVLQAASTVKNVYAAAQEAYLYYSVAMEATADAAIASSMAADAFVNAMMASMNPATIAIAIAIHFVMEYLMKACDQMSMETAMEADSGMCHEVGTYCKKKVPLLGCVQKATSYCCYNSILARIIQEQGRPQLTTFNGWGTPESPQCRGFTPEEFQQLDFSKINLDEYVQTMVTAATSEIQESVTTITESFYDKTN